MAKEVLTDQGRQYTSWRGKTRFERELVKDRVKHIKSQASFCSATKLPDARTQPIPSRLGSVNDKGD